MRFHPALYQNYRQVGRDDVLPLSKPITTSTGEVINKLPIAKGTKIVLSIAAYNRQVNSLVRFLAGTNNFGLSDAEIKMFSVMMLMSTIRKDGSGNQTRRDLPWAFMVTCE